MTLAAPQVRQNFTYRWQRPRPSPFPAAGEHPQRRLRRSAARLRTWPVVLCAATVHADRTAGRKDADPASRGKGAENRTGSVRSIQELIAAHCPGLRALLRLGGDLVLLSGPSCRAISPAPPCPQVQQARRHTDRHTRRADSPAPGQAKQAEQSGSFCSSIGEAWRRPHLGANRQTEPAHETAGQTSRSRLLTGFQTHRRSNEAEAVQAKAPAHGGPRGRAPQMAAAQTVLGLHGLSAPDPWPMLGDDPCKVPEGRFSPDPPSGDC